MRKKKESNYGSHENRNKTGQNPFTALPNMFKDISSHQRENQSCKSLGWRFTSM